MIPPMDFIFLNFTFTLTLMGSLMTTVEKYLPSFIRQSFRYGKFGINDSSNKLLSALELKKANCRHYYAFAAIISVVSVIFAVRVYFYTFYIPHWVITFLDIFCGSTRSTELRPLVTLVSLLLLSAQCLRRFYETYFIQVFSNSGKINLTHYLVGYFHYFGCFTVILANSAGFSGREDISKIDFFDWQSLLMIPPSVAIFSLAWINQYRSNLILVNLRKDKKSNSVVSQKHFLPEGGWFRYVSNPHLLCEILMYLALTLLLLKSYSWLLIVGWVLSNQTVTAILSHRWYKETFPQYPKERKALVPFLF